MSEASKGGVSGIIDHLEESIIAILMGAMTLITFANVVARYVLNANILWALEATVFLFAWMVLLGVSYGVKKSLHLGVDVMVGALAPATRKIVTLIAVACCIAYAVLMLIGSWDYWYPFVSKRAWLETDDIPMPFFLRFFEGWLNEGEVYEKMPRFIPYAVLPISMALLTFRFLQAGWDIYTGKRNTLIAGHEAEEELAQAAAKED
jgi:C4-dicarboxylate transporter, DctQ subunit